MSDENTSRMKTSLIQLKKIMSPSKGSRRGASSRISKAVDYVAKAGPIESRIKAFVLDCAIVLAFAGFLIYRNAHSHFGVELTYLSPKVFIYAYVYFGLSIVPLRLFGQTAGMVAFNIKLLNNDYSYPTFLKLIQRETIGLIMNSTIGAATFFSEKKVLTDEMFGTEVIQVEREDNQKDS